MRERANEPEPLGGVGPCPDRLGHSIAEVWDYIVSCAAAGVLTAMDRIAMQLAAALLARLWQSVSDPETKFEPKHAARLHALMASFGMTPADRSRVSLDRPPTRSNPFARFRPQS
jgi:hypothetical protein